MIVDTSAMIAALLHEEGHEAILDAIEDEQSLVPAPALGEFWTVVSGARLNAVDQASALLAEWQDGGLTVLPFNEVHAMRVREAIPLYGRGNGSGGLLNLLDLMVYAVAKESGEPLLCTGKDFAATDIALHGASRPW
ncbi:MAG TPA: type II toxin-antitoxin system VapC family toxin [Sphingobium sp.]|uniref:type II toxin-antitoxin system VapC family toxin n=1 Tax=Sphingobium sp. TaxID=1912891 RepID=UPI002ED3CC7C